MVTVTTGDRLRFFALGAAPERVIAYGASWLFHDDGYRMDLVVTPDWRRRGIGAALLAVLELQAAAVGAVTLQARSDDRWVESVTFLHARGFVETMRMHRQVLRVSEATLGGHRHLEPRLADDGIVITTMAREEALDPLCWAKFSEVRHAAGDGWVDPDPRPLRPPPRPPEEFRRWYLASARSYQSSLDECFLARQGDRYVGFTGVVGTGVRPECRGRGVATALKVRAVAYARDHGVSTMETSSGNPAMLLVNERLGFRRTSTEIRLVKRLRSTGNEQEPER